MGHYTGAFHVHSTFSDGELSLEQIAALARAQQLDFVVCADHAPHLKKEQIATLVRECAALNVGGFLMMPGLEFELEGRHVVALGPGELLGELDAATVVQHPEEVRARGGFTIWAHPAVTFDWRLKRPMQLAYDAWEVWNRRADGERPSLPVQAALRKVARRQSEVRVLAGVDFHRGNAIGGPLVTVEAEELTFSGLLEALREGRFEINLPEQAPSLWSQTAGVARYASRRAYCVLALARHRLLRSVGLKQRASEIT